MAIRPLKLKIGNKGCDIFAPVWADERRLGIEIIHRDRFTFQHADQVDVRDVGGGGTIVALIRNGNILQRQRAAHDVRGKNRGDKRIILRIRAAREMPCTETTLPVPASLSKNRP